MICTYTQDIDGTPLLFDPASKGFSMVCQFLLNNVADPLAKTKTGVSPLYAASRKGHKSTVKVFLQFGADVTKVCNEVSISCNMHAID